METYSVEKIQDEWVVKDASGNVVVAFLRPTAFNTAKEAEKYAERLNERFGIDKYRAMSSALNRVFDTASVLQDFIKTLRGKMEHTESISSACSMERSLDDIHKELDNLKQAVAALPSAKEFYEMNELITKKGLFRTRGY